MPGVWDAPITQGFGPTNEPLDGPYGGYAHFNRGLDYGAPEGTPIPANVSGTVISAQDHGDGWGLAIRVQDAQGNIHNYGHLGAIDVKPGDKVTPGMLLGKVGNTGKSTGPHLSYDVWDSQGTPVDPSPWATGAPASDFSGSAGGGGGSDGGTFDFSQYDIPALPFSTADYYTKLARWNALDTALKPYLQDSGNPRPGIDGFFDPDYGYVVRVPSGETDEYGNEMMSEFVAMDPASYKEYTSLTSELDNWEGTYTKQGADLDRLLTLLDHYSKTDPRLIDAENAADKFSRELDVRQEARQAATAQYQEQTDRQNAAFDQNNAMLAGQTRMVMAPALKLTPYEELYAKARDMVASGLPEVPDKPYPYRMGAGQLGALTRPAAPGPTRSSSAFGGRLPEEGDPNRAGNGSGRLPVSTIAPQPSSSPAMSRASFLDKFDLKGSTPPVRDTSAFRLADDLASRQYGPAAPNIPTQRMMPFTPTATQTPNRGVSPSYNRTAGTITPSIFR